jgi:flagellar hook-associated protein 3 FlgL
MNQAGSVVQRLRELTVQGSTGTNPQSALDSINEEVKELREQLVDISNSKLNGKYVFNGETYDVKPYDFPSNPDGSLDFTNALSVVTDQGKINFIVGESVQLPINVSGNEVFGTGTETDNLFAKVNNIIKALTEGDTAGLSKQLDNIDTRMDKMLAIRSEIGAKTNRIDLMKGRLDDLNINLTDLQAKVEDADYAELAMKSKIQENIYNASLSAGAKIISPSLVDFLR